MPICLKFWFLFLCLSIVFARILLPTWANLLSILRFLLSTKRNKKRELQWTFTSERTASHEMRWFRYNVIGAHLLFCCASWKQKSTRKIWERMCTDAECIPMSFVNAFFYKRERFITENSEIFRILKFVFCPKDRRNESIPVQCSTCKSLIDIDSCLVTLIVGNQWQVPNNTW